MTFKRPSVFLGNPNAPEPIRLRPFRAPPPFVFFLEI